jgi:hypothetical protein
MAGISVDGAAAIGRDAAMERFRTIALAACGLVWLGAANGAAADPASQRDGPSLRRAAGALTSELSSQQRRLRRAPVRITVYPRGIPTVGRSGSRIDLYPRPYPYEWPGPFAKRDCIAWLAAEARPSGPVVVPHRRCWWYPG